MHQQFLHAATSSRNYQSNHLLPDLLDRKAVCRLFGGTKPINPSTLLQALITSFGRCPSIGSATATTIRSRLLSNPELRLFMLECGIRSVTAVLLRT
jgi:hypothetical protein